MSNTYTPESTPPHHNSNATQPTNLPTNQTTSQPEYKLMVSIPFLSIGYTNKDYSNTIIVISFYLC